MQSVLSWIWTRVAVSISYDDNDYTMGTSNSYNMMDNIIFTTILFGEVCYTKKH